jgi:hypothetical protein
MFQEERRKKDEKGNAMLMAIEHSLLSKGVNNSFTSNTFIADSGAACQMQGSLEVMFNLIPYVTNIMVGNNKVMSSVSMGHYKGIVLKPDGSTMELTLIDKPNIPKLKVNLFPLTKALKTKGFQLSIKRQLISLKTGNMRYFMTRFLNMPDVFLGLRFIPIRITSRLLLKPWT